MALGDQAGWLSGSRGEIRRRGNPHSRNRKIPNKRFPYLVEPLRGLPDGTIVDGKIVALDDDGRPVFNLLQKYASESVRTDRVEISDFVEASAEQMLSAVREQRLEGIVGKQKDSVYEPGKRSGAWIKHRVNLSQEFVIGGFTPGPHGLDAVIVGYHWNGLMPII